MNTSIKVELKKEFTERVNHILTPIILEGLQQIYNTSKEACNNNKVLSTFQSLLKRIPAWEQNVLNREVERIQTVMSKQHEYFLQLLQALYSISMSLNGLSSNDISKYNIKFHQFIHKVYIECARTFYIDPFLFYHNYAQFQQKKNYYEIVAKINEAIEKTIRNLIPIKLICEKLGVEFKAPSEMSTDELYNADLLVKKVIDNLKTENVVSEKVGGGNVEQLNQVMPAMQAMPAAPTMPAMPAAPAAPIMNVQPIANQTGAGYTNGDGIILNDTLEKNVNEQILNIINQNKVLSESYDGNHFTVNNHTQNDEHRDDRHSSRRSSSTLKRVINDSIKHSHHTARTNSNRSEMKNKILKELDTETVTYNPEQNGDNYQDIYSNSDVKHNTVNTNEKNEEKSRNKFFNNYLNF